MVLLALFGAVMGQGVIWYTGQFYAQNFLETKCNIEFEQSRTIMLWAIVFATPFFLFFGWLSDRIGRKWIMMTGMLLGILTYRPIFNTFLKESYIPNLLLENPTAKSDENLVLKTDSLVENQALVTLKHYSAKWELNDGTKFTELKTDTTRQGFDGFSSSQSPDKKPSYTNKHLSSSKYWKFVGLVFLLILYVTMVYGPIAAFLVELFPTKIRYTSMSLPYHIGNGVFGGLVPFIGLLLTTTYPKDPLVGLWYPIGVAALCFIIGSIYLSNEIDRDVMD
jgi:MFS family permease